MIRAGSLGWFAAHELRLSWRDWLTMMTAGEVRRERAVYVVVAVFAALLHVLAYAVIAAPLTNTGSDNLATLSVLSGTLALAFFMMTSQALEHVTRAFYGRSDMELILSSPAASRNVFAVRIVAIAISTSIMAMLLATPFINVAIWLSGAGWIAAYLVIFAIAGLATAFSVLVTIGLFRTIGAKRTRFVAQVFAAVIGAGFLIAAQVSAILSQGDMSRFAIFSSQDILSGLPPAASFVWLPARAVMGDLGALAAVAGVAAVVLGIVVLASAHRFGADVVAAAGLSETRIRQRPRSTRWRRMSSATALRVKEWKLLARDPWLISQTLMQILYLLPPAVLLWRNYGDSAGTFVILAPVLVMAMGQLAGGLAWLAISGEDAADLISSAPVESTVATRAKVEAVLVVIMAAAAPFLVAMFILAPLTGAIVATGIILSAVSAVAIQLWFRVPSSRNHFRRRQTASKTATFSEAFSSIMWAGATALAAAQSLFCLFFALMAVAIVVLAWAISPGRRA